ncbi:MAG: hypothetical protein VBE63_21620 [Lamprobacter sp.]|nr:hypothetical protein [Lamprobacter sp.]MEA3642516.1 hypothetical protein [Lamprobacter sp.]
MQRLDLVETDQGVAVVIEEQLRLVELGAIGTILEIEGDGRRIA